MRYSISLILFLLCTSELTALQPHEQKWTATLDNSAPIETMPVIAPDGGTIYIGAGSKLYAIPTTSDNPSSHSRTPLPFYQFPHPLDTSPAVSPDGDYLYMAYARPPNAFIAIFDLKQANLTDPISLGSEHDAHFSTPTVDKTGAVYFTVTSRFDANKLVKISGDKMKPVVKEIRFEYFTESNPLSRKNIGPAVYSNRSNASAGGAVMVGTAYAISPTNFEKYKYAYLFYTSFENHKSEWCKWRNYYCYRGWGSYLENNSRVPSANYSAPAIDNNTRNNTSLGTIYIATSKGELEAYRGELDNYYSSPNVPLTWSQPLSDNDLSQSVPVVANNGTVYIGDPTAGILYVFNHITDKADAKLAIRLSDDAGITAPPAIDNKNDLVYIVDNNGSLYAIDARSRTVLWSDKSAHAINSPVVGSDGTVVIGTKDNKIVAYQGGR